MIPKILIIPARKHSIEAYTEYLIRYLSDEFYFEMGYPPMAEFYSSIKKNVWGGATSPLEKNPDDFDLIYPHFATHWFLEPPEKYAHKIAVVLFESKQVPRFPDKIAAWGVTVKPLKEEFPNAFELRFGIDTNLFAPYKMVRLDNKFHVGFIGNIMTPRRYIKELFIPLANLVGVKLDIYPTGWFKHTRVDEIESIGGQVALDNIREGDKWWSGFPNCYNYMDVYVRCDISLGYQLSLLEAAACGIPVVTTDPGLGKELCVAGGGIYVACEDNNWQPDVLEELSEKIKSAVKLLRDHPEQRKEMGKNGRTFVEEQYTWEKWIPAWREFFRTGLKNAKKAM